MSNGNDTKSKTKPEETDIVEDHDVDKHEGDPVFTARDLSVNPVTEPPMKTPIVLPTLPEGIEALDIVENMPYNLAKATIHILNAVNTLQRREDIAKAIFYLKREQTRMEKYGEFS